MNILITICARGGSKGIPGKNIKLINGKPLIDYTIRVANSFKNQNNAKITLSTDDNNIKQAAEKAGIFTKYVRPKFLASDTAGKIDTILDLLVYEESLSKHKFDYILDLDVTSPLRNLNDLEKSFDIIKNSNALSLFSVNHASRNPYFNMVEISNNGFYTLVKKNSEVVVMTRQTAPDVFELNASFYWYKRVFFDLGLKTPITDESLIYVMPHICFDLDHPIDFDFMEYLINQNKLDFDL